MTTLLRGGGTHGDLFYHIVSFSNLYSAWREFKRGKTNKKEIVQFEFRLEDNLIQLARQLQSGTYVPDPYVPFYVQDPKRRHIHKATVRDRIVHQAIYRVISPIFERQFIDDSFACRKGKGTHRGVDRLERFLIDGSKNTTQAVWALKCDIRKFFDTVDHSKLKKCISRRISDEKTLALIDVILGSFEKGSYPPLLIQQNESWSNVQEGKKGLPLGNVTSQLFGNIYLHELDRYMKHTLKCKRYIRYCDDFVVVSQNKSFLESLVSHIADFLLTELKVVLHPNKIHVRKYRQGVDFLGYILLPYYRVLRKSTKKRIKKKFKAGQLNQQQKISYLGILSHANCYSMRQKL